MGRTAKIWLITAAVLVVLGLILFAAAMQAHTWDFDSLCAETYEINVHKVNETFHNIAIDTDTADILLALSQDGKCTVECYEASNAKHSVTVEEGTLTIKLVDKKAWYDYIGIHIDTPKITVYLPETAYTSLRVNTSSGDICVANASAQALDLAVSTGMVTVSNVVCREDVSITASTGKAKLTGVTCRTLTSDADTGDILLSDVIAQEKISITRSTGDVRFDGVDAPEIFVDTDTGDVTGHLLTDKVFYASTDTGSVHVPNTATGGRCEVSTNTGDIKLTVKG